MAEFLNTPSADSSLLSGRPCRQLHGLPWLSSCRPLCSQGSLKPPRALTEQRLAHLLKRRRTRVDHLRGGTHQDRLVSLGGSTEDHEQRNVQEREERIDDRRPLASIFFSILLHAPKTSRSRTPLLPTEELTWGAL